MGSYTIYNEDDGSVFKRIPMPKYPVGHAVFIWDSPWGQDGGYPSSGVVSKIYQPTLNHQLDEYMWMYELEGYGASFEIYLTSAEDEAPSTW